ncbi:MAG: copper homeostasis protein CutC [Bacteroidales bacterium]|nr:copper homeostasis protein CutC [Bacteroidales bacterium]
MSFSLVPGFAQRYPKDDDNNPSAAPDERHSRLDLESGSGCTPSPIPDDRHSRPDRASLLIETCCTTLEQARSAESRGAGRIEFCADLSVGGVTPPRDLIRDVLASLTIPVNVLIRPSGKRSPVKPGMTNGVMPGPDRASGFSAADFVYDKAEIDQMIADIEFCKTVGVAGIVVGALTPEGAIDREVMRRLIAAASPLPVTFHRAYDVCTTDPFIALDQIIALGCTRLLTSGQAPNAWDGRGVLALLVRRAGRRLIVMPGCGVTPDNLAALAAITYATEFHGTAIP